MRTTGKTTREREREREGGRETDRDKLRQTERERQIPIIFKHVGAAALLSDSTSLGRTVSLLAKR